MEASKPKATAESNDVKPAGIKNAKLDSIANMAKNIVAQATASENIL